MRRFYLIPGLCVAFFASSSSSFGTMYPANQCQTGSLVTPAGCTMLSTWCEGTIGAQVPGAPGSPNVVTGAGLACDACDANCGKPERVPPAGKTCTLSLTVSFKDTHSQTVTGGISSSVGLIADLTTKLDIAAGYSEDTAPGVTVTVAVTVASCAWQQEAATMTVTKGKSLTQTGQIQPRGTARCPNPSGTGTTDVTVSTATVTGTVTETYDMAIRSSAKAKTLDNGTCPPTTGAPG